MTQQSSYRIFDVNLVRRELLSPNMARLTFGGPQVGQMTTTAPDQRIKIFFPKPDGGRPDIPHRPDWYDLYRAIPVTERAPMRTYTIRNMRSDDCEVDVDFVLHGDEGPASRWANNAALGDPAQISAPNRAFDGPNRGYEWRPPEAVEHVLLIADFTALPAGIGILEELATCPTPPRTQAFFEIPTEEDRLAVPSWPGLDVRWMIQAGSGGAYGTLMRDAAEEADLPGGAGACARGDKSLDEDGDALLVWDRAETSGAGFYGWVAGETEAVRQIRNLLVKERGIDKSSVNLMGYWRHGKVLD
jgi:NADPH-dependent ferric siderophore reductase